MTSCLSQHIIKCYWIKSHCWLLQFVNLFFCFLLLPETVRLDTLPELYCRALGTVMSCTAQFLICLWRAKLHVTEFNLLSPLFVSLWCISGDVWNQLAITGHDYTPITQDTSSLFIQLVLSSVWDILYFSYNPFLLPTLSKKSAKIWHLLLNWLKELFCNHTYKCFLC